ncbi:Uncharacterised protein [Rodentibacter pneumotropicus]|uniref:Uncharacterized protein n=1 Tax=Rodentibacter pneumotropicus TaxID=758 RepID=A0A3S4TYM7_9PAST|nr:Uncharacterised protein [Rodentibacter pneumotropicus]
MNNSRKPTFQTNTNKSFQERSFDGQQHSKKHRENRPHFDKKMMKEKATPFSARSS